MLMQRSQGTGGLVSHSVLNVKAESASKPFQALIMNLRVDLRLKL